MDSQVPPGFEPEEPKSLVPAGFIPEEKKSVVPEGFVPEDTSEIPHGFEPEKPEAPDYNSPYQKFLAAKEGLARGLSGGLSDIPQPKPEGKLMTEVMQPYGPPPTPEEMYARKTANPELATGANVLGNVALSAMLPEMKFAQLGTKGALALKGAIASGLFKTGDEISDSLLGHGNPIPAAAAHIVGASLVGAPMGMLSWVPNKIISSALSTKAGTAIKSFLYGIGHSASYPEKGLVDLAQSELKDIGSGLSNMGFRAGQALYNSKIGIAAATLGGVIGHHAHDLFGTGAGTSLGRAIGGFIDKVVGKHLDNVSKKYVGNAALKLASSGNVEGFTNLIDHMQAMAKGSRVIEKGVEGLFNSVPAKGYDYYQKANPEHIEKTKEHLENNDEKEKYSKPPLAQEFADGGQVQNIQEQPNHFAEHFPEQNILMNASKMRVANYLNSVRPLKNPSSLPYDREHKDRQKERDYNQTLHLALKPMSVLGKIKDGSLLPKDMAAFNSMYPEVHEQLSKKITERMLQGKLKGEKKPPYKVRQAMSLFLGSNLDSSLSQPNMMAAQMVFANQKAQQQIAKKANALSKMGVNTATAEQAREKRLNKS